MQSSHRARPGTADMELKIAPLIDCVFLMLTYFIFTISLSTMEGLLPSKMALGNEDQKEQQKPDDKKEVMVRIVQTGGQVQYFIDDWPVANFDSVRSHMDRIDKAMLVVIDSGPNVMYDHVIRLYNYCLRIEIERVVFPLESGASRFSRSSRS